MVVVESVGGEHGHLVPLPPAAGLVASQEHSTDGLVDATSMWRLISLRTLALAGVAQLQHQVMMTNDSIRAARGRQRRTPARRRDRAALRSGGDQTGEGRQSGQCCVGVGGDALDQLGARRKVLDEPDHLATGHDAEIRATVDHRRLQ